MFTIELILRGNPVALAVQRKDQTAAGDLYAKIRDAMNASPPRVIELTCDKVPEKHLAVMSSDVVAVQLTAAKSGSGAPMGMRAGFFAGESEDE
ncbi:hypothetical protein [Gloeobacter violaceus]|uniref:UPF0367 protein gsr3177 n=1 Tax=Gloeobacter violaceus (strain ATCC 29082 / PCC 7421) TaxID=251221 RepID=Y3177_GLOVI|nr:hypothetical protein [Gloeobacter violaceus]Q7NGJ2.1 RecName: Full=UPF0367 protein gsr3177 [Gloeobacter violaceus PCC 7421]BAC91118.1 gsr3177 [Gloeobacter violaceus PCC 7421]